MARALDAHSFALNFVNCSVSTGHPYDWVGTKYQAKQRVEE